MRRTPPLRLRRLAGDEEAMLRVKDTGDPRAFAYLVRRWEGPIHRLCVRMTGDAHTAEDLTQEAFLRVFARRRTYEATARFSTFLWRVALNLCYDHLRRAGWDVERLADDAAPAMLGLHSPSPRADACLERQERAEWVQGALIRLPTPYRVVVVLRHYEGLRFREIAEVLGVPEGTVKSRMAEALHRLAKLLQPIVQEYMDVPRRPRG